MSHLSKKPLALYSGLYALGLVIGAAAPATVLADDEENQTDKVDKSSPAYLETTHVEGNLTRELDAGALGNRSVLDTPFSITVVDAEELTERGAKSVGQIFVNDPSVYTPTSSATTDWWGAKIRGLDVRNYYIDDYPILLYWGGDFPVEAVESVTALKGLTGFMHGFGAPGGAISYQLERPQDLAETTFNLGYRNSSLFSAQLDTANELGAGFKYRVNLAGENGTAYNAAEIDRTVAALALEKDFGYSLTWLTNLTYEDSINTGEPFQFYFSDYDVEGSGGRLPRVTYDYDDINIDNGYYETNTLIGSTGLKWQINSNTIAKIQTGFTRKEHLSNKSFAYLLNQEGDYSGYAYNFAGLLETKFNQIMLNSSLTTGSITHDVVAGIGNQRSTDRWGGEWYWENDFNGNLYEEQTFQVTRTPDFSLEPISFDERQMFGFISDTLHFSEKLQAILGLRYSDYELKDFDGDPEVDSGYNTQATTPTLALIYKPHRHSSLYTSYVESLEPGSRVGEIYANAGEILDATVSKQFEIGAKYELQKVNFTTAIFSIERAAEMVVERSDLLYYTQDGLTTFNGIEFSGAYQFTDNLRLGLGLIHLDAVIDDVSADNAAIEGNDPGYAADWQIVSNAEYRIAAIDGLKLHGNVRYYGESFTDDSNTLEVPARTVVNTGVSYDFNLGNQECALNANINNLLNEKYWAGGGWSQGNIGEARNFSLGLEIRL